MADITERLPYAISKRMSSMVAEIVNRNGREIHYTVAGVPFRVATSSDTPLSLDTAPVQKNQQDTEPDAGEQTFSGWWLRSQASWHEGAGALYIEPRLNAQALRVQDSAQFRYSSNVDVWTPGVLSLLNATTDFGVGTTNLSVSIIPGGTGQSIVVGRSGEVRQYTNMDAGTTPTVQLYSGAGVNFTQVIATEAFWYAAGNDGKVYSGPIGVNTASPSIWTLTGATAANPTRIVWAKHRLWAINSNKIYNLNATTPGATAATYTHPSTGWSYTDLTDGPGGIYFSGYGDGTSHIQRITLDATGAVPTLSAATTLAVLPSDERVLRINCLAGQMVCIVTNFGVRVAVADVNGNLQYGPLFLERTTEVPYTVKTTLHSAGRFWWVGFGDESKLWRVDSSTEVEDGVFAYASDMETSSAPQSISVRAERVVVVTSTGTVQYTHASNLCSTGYVQTGRIRFRTDEFKTYHYIDCTADPLQGSIVLDVLNDADSLANVLTWSTQGKALPSAQFPATFGRQRFVSIKLTLNRSGTDSTKGPVIYGVRVKALPAGQPQRIYTLPLQCYDRETWTTGQQEGYDGFAYDRYLSVRAAEDAGGVVMLVNYGFPQPQGELCRIEELKFVQLVPPDSVQQDGGFGGLLLVTLRTLT